MTATTRSTAGSVLDVVYVAMDLGQREWTLAVTVGLGIAPLVRTIQAGDWQAWARVVETARQKWGVGAAARVVSCYEAGRDGFWIHRALTARGVDNRVVDSSSVLVDRRARHSKSDRLDAVKLVAMLGRVLAGESGVWREVRVPTPAEEAARHRSRERTNLTQERTRLTNQITSWLATWGVVASRPLRARAAWWTQVRDWTGAPLAAEVQARIARAGARLTVIREQLRAVEGEQAAQRPAAVVRLSRLKGVAAISAAVLVDEGLEWRQFRNRRQVGGMLGFAPVRAQSGTVVKDQGISRAGNPRLQAVTIQLAWSWVRWQPESALTQWFHAHFGARARARRIGIVAVARKLLILLWRYVTQGVVPAGVIVKASAAA